MHSMPVVGKDNSGRFLVLMLAAVMGSFVLTSWVSRNTSAEIESLSETLVATTTPSIERLASVRGLVLEVEYLLSEYTQTDAVQTFDSEVLDQRLTALDADVRNYLQLVARPGERPHGRDIELSLAHFDRAVQRTAELAQAGQLSAADRTLKQDVEPAANELINSTLRTIEFHAQDGRAIASRIREARRKAVALTSLLTAVSVLLGSLGLFLVIRQARRNRALLEAQSRFHEARANELEHFAGRVAHDIRNPLSAAKMGAELALRRGLEGPAKDAVVRISRTLDRAEEITSGLLEFARSGANPDPGARADPCAILQDMLTGMEPEVQQQQIELRIEHVSPVMVGCSTGVYLSLVGNLVRNAIKYMGDSSTRQISVRVTDEGDKVRTEVRDTGPGIPTETLPSLFQPYFRISRDRTKEGLGLGLATVKKLAEGHQGAVGVHSERGKGSTFWFTLPRAGTAPLEGERPAQTAPPTRH